MMASTDLTITSRLFNMGKDAWGGSRCARPSRLPMFLITTGVSVMVNMIVSQSCAATEIEVTPCVECTPIIQDAGCGPLMIPPTSLQLDTMRGAIIIIGLAVLHISRRVRRQHGRLVELERRISTIKDAPASPPDKRTETIRVQCGQSVTADSESHRYRVVLAAGLLPLIHGYVSAFLRRHGREMEAGGVLVGEFSRGDGISSFTVNGFIEAGPKADFSAGSILFDNEYQQQVLDAIRLQYPSVGNIGAIHRQPGGMDECSSGDEVTDREAVHQSNTKAMLFGIITVNNPRRDADSIHYREFKLDFYVLSAGTSDYVKVRPALEDIPLVKTSSALVEISKRRGRSAFHDFAVLRSLPEISHFYVEDVHVEGSTTWLCTIRTRMDDEIRILQEAHGGITVWLTTRDESSRCFQGPWEQPVIGDHIWLSHIVLMILKRRDQALPDTFGMEDVPMHKNNND